MSNVNALPAFEVEPFTGEYTKKVYTAKKDEKTGKHLGFTTEDKTFKGGYMVYMPAGHSIHVETDEELIRLGFATDPKLIDMNSGEEVPGSVSLKRRVEAKTRNTRN